MYVRRVGVIYAEQRLLQTSAECEALDDLETNVCGHLSYWFNPILVDFGGSISL